MKEQDIMNVILGLLKVERIFAFRLNTGGFSGVYKGKKWFVRPHSLGNGAADILAFGHRISGWGVMPIWIEVKNEKGQQSEAQKQFQSMVEEFGHRYILARSVDDIRELWESRIHK